MHLHIYIFICLLIDLYSSAHELGHGYYNCTYMKKFKICLCLEVDGMGNERKMCNVSLRVHTDELQLKVQVHNEPQNHLPPKIRNPL